MLWLIFPIENLRFWSPCMIMKSVHWVRSFIRCNIYNLGNWWNCVARHLTSNQRRTFCSMRNFNDDLAESITCWVLLIESAHLVWLVWGSTLLKIWFLLFYSRLSLHVVYELFYSNINYILYKRSICVEFEKCFFRLNYWFFVRFFDITPCFIMQLLRDIGHYSWIRAIWNFLTEHFGRWLAWLEKCISFDRWVTENQNIAVFCSLWSLFVFEFTRFSRSSLWFAPFA